MILFDCSYEEVVDDKEKYKKGKSGVFAEIYGGNEKTLATQPQHKRRAGKEGP